MSAKEEKKIEISLGEYKELKYDCSYNFHDAEELNQKLMEIIDERNKLDTKLIQLENIRKEAIEYINHATIGADSSPIEDSWLYNLYETRHILNKGDNKE